MRTFKLIILGIFVLYFQIIFSGQFVLFDLIPNFLIAYIIYLGIKSSPRTTLTISFIWGLAFDLLQPQFMGMNSLAFIFIALIVTKFHETINKQRLEVVGICIFAINFFYYLLFLFYQMISAHIMTGFLSLFLSSVIYNTFITIFSIFFLVLFSKLKIVINV